MSPLEIKFLVLKKFGTITACAMALGYRREELSMCINGQRQYPQLRLRLAEILGMTVEQLFGPDVSRKAA
jgi:plasmid maintenance system antidote protein VapI